jgi:hypothetical protein
MSELGREAGGAAVNFLVGYMVRGARNKARVDPQTGETVLEYGTPMKALALCMAVVIPSLILILVCFAPPKDAAVGWAVGGGIAGVCSIGGFVQLMDTTKAVAFLSPEGIRARSAWRRGERFIGWDDVTNVGFSKANKWFVIQGRHKVTIRIEVCMNGTTSLVEAMKKYLPHWKYLGAAGGFEIVQTGGTRVG